MEFKVAAAISDALARSGMTQKELAQRAGITQSYVSQICAGKKQPTLAVLLSLCEILNIQIQELMENSTPVPDGPKPLTREEDALLALYRGMTREDQSFFTRLAGLLARGRKSGKKAAK